MDERLKRALFRFQVIAPLISGSLSKSKAARARREALDRTYTTPDGTTWKISRRTLRRWLRRFEKEGFAGLYDRSPGTYGASRAIPETVLRAAARLREQERSLSIRQILNLLPFTEELENQEIDVEDIARSTLARQLNRRGAKKEKKDEGDGSYQRWDQKYVNDVWQADTCDGLWLPDPYRPSRMRKTYLISFIDDASRYVTFARFYWDTQLPSLLDCFKKALLSKGKPARTYWDNAWIFHSTTVTLLCAELGIRPSFSKKGRPPGRGKIERHIRTVQEGFLRIAEHAGIKTLDELNQFFVAWLTREYHKVEHKELGTTPLARWLMDRDRIERVSPASVRRGLMLRCDRKVDRKTAEVRLNKVRYQAGANLAGEKVEVRYHFDDASQIEIWQRGVLIEIAVPTKPGANIDFSRHVEKENDKQTRRGIPHRAFKAYRAKIVGEHEPVSSGPRQSNLLSEKEWVELFSEMLSRALSVGEDEYVRRFFFLNAPLDKQRTKEVLETIVSVCGSDQHVGAYCQRLLEATTYGGDKI